MEFEVFRMWKVKNGKWNLNEFGVWRVESGIKVPASQVDFNWLDLIFSLGYNGIN